MREISQVKLVKIDNFEDHSVDLQPMEYIVSYYKPMIQGAAGSFCVNFIRMKNCGKFPIDKQVDDTFHFENGWYSSVDAE